MLEALVVGAPHESLGELATTFVVLHPGATASEKELVDFVNEQVLNAYYFLDGWFIGPVGRDPAFVPGL